MKAFLWLPLFIMCVGLFTSCGGASDSSNITKESATAVATEEPTATSTPEYVRYLGIPLHHAMKALPDDAKECDTFLFDIVDFQDPYVDALGNALVKNIRCFQLSGTPQTLAAFYPDVLKSEGWTVSVAKVKAGVTGWAVSGVRKQGLEQVAIGSMTVNGKTYVVIGVQPAD